MNTWKFIAIALFVNLAACTEKPVVGEYTGYVEAEYIYVAAPQSGWLEEAPLVEGSVVAPGDLIFRLDDDLQTAKAGEAAARVSQAEALNTDMETGARPEEIARLEAELADARASLTLAKAEQSRIMPLVEQGFATPARGDQANAAVAKAAARVNAASKGIEVAGLEARSGQRAASGAAIVAAEQALEGAQWTLGERAVTAKIAGRVEEVFRREGEFVGAGAPVVALLPSTGGMKVRFFVPQGELPSLGLGDFVTVKADGADATNAKVFFIASEPEFTPPVIYSARSRAKLVFLVEARLEDGAKLHPGLPVDVLAP